MVWISDSGVCVTAESHTMLFGFRSQLEACESMCSLSLLCRYLQLWTECCFITEASCSPYQCPSANYDKLLCTYTCNISPFTVSCVHCRYWLLHICVCLFNSVWWREEIPCDAHPDQFPSGCPQLSVGGHREWNTAHIPIQCPLSRR